MLKNTAVVGLAGLVLGVSPAAADSIDNGATVALTMIGGGGAMSIGCMAIALLTQDYEDEQEGYDRRGFYFGLGPSYARENFSDSASLDDIDEDAPGVTGRGGYRCHPYISAELQFEWLDDFDFKGTISGVGTPQSFDGNLEPLVFTDNVKGHLLTGRYQPFVLLGVGFMRMEAKVRAASFRTRETTVDVAMRFGGGLDFYITENIVATAEASYLMPTGELDDLDYYQFGVGLQYRF